MLSDVDNSMINENEEITIDEKNNQESHKAFLKLKEHGRFSRTRAMRLKPNDFIIAVDGKIFQETSDELTDILSEEDIDYWIITIFRNGNIFEVSTRGPLGGTFEYSKPDETKLIGNVLSEHTFHNKNDYKIFEVLKDIKKNCDIYDTTYNRLAVYAPPLWLIQERMWEPLIAILSVYLITINVNTILFLISAILISLYLRKGQVTLRRSYSMYQDRQVWMTIAAVDELNAQKTCRALDPKCKFNNSLVGPPAKDDNAKVKKRKRSGDLRVTDN